MTYLENVFQQRKTWDQREKDSKLQTSKGGEKKND